DRGRHHVPAHAEHDVRVEAIDDAKAAAQGRGNDNRQREVLPERIAVEPAHVDSGEVETLGGNEPHLRAALAPNEQQSAIRLLSAKRVRDRERRIEVPTGPAASYQKSHLSFWYAQIRCPLRSGRRSAAPRPRPGWARPPCLHS